MTTTPAPRDEREVVSTAPERIYLIIGEECPDSARFEDLTDVAWCEDKIDSNAIPYVKAALAESELAEARKEIEYQKKRANDGLDRLDGQALQISELRAELERVKADAVRYQWLCGKFEITKLPCAIERILSGEVYVADGKGSVDAAIDAARGVEG